MRQAKKFFLKETLSILATAAIVSGIVYAAAGNISSVTTQSIGSGAIMEQGWFQQANDKLLAHDAAILALSGRIATLEAGGGGGGGMASAATWAYSNCTETSWDSGVWAWSPIWWETMDDTSTLVCWQAGATANAAPACTNWTPYAERTRGLVSPSPAGCVSGLLVGHAPTTVTLTVSSIEASDWPAVGTQYKFGAGAGQLAFGTEHKVFEGGGNTLWLTVTNASGVTNLRVRSNDFSADWGGVTFNTVMQF